MPGFDGTGPMGQGPMTGGARGYCTSAGMQAAQPNVNPAVRFGMGRGSCGRGMGRGRRGMGRGMGRGFGRQMPGGELAANGPESRPGTRLSLPRGGLEEGE